ncbi:DUF4378 domain-containing protein [Quillaja saponaria]|uniref:DUF4378 domain-containing protein n=1 Tax=Quillaja saponaria TaxID=32244 RepID=A0AAD7PTP7_QUISA|nr:DUF4378 domain-containing protein [Quillaja saponaria]
MASEPAKPLKKLGELLLEQQEPFILEVYLSERRHSKRSSTQHTGYEYSSESSGNVLERSVGCDQKERKKGLPKCPKIIKDVYSKLVFVNENKVSKNSENRNEDLSVLDTGRNYQIGMELDRFSSASSTTVYNSCSPSDVEEASTTSLQKYHASFSADTKQASRVCNMRLQEVTKNSKNRRRHRDIILPNPVSLKELSLHGYSMFHKDDVRLRLEQSPHRCRVFLPKKVTEDSILSASLWEILFESETHTESSNKELQDLWGPNIPQVLKSKRVLQQTKQLLFDCVREIVDTLPKKENGEERQEFLGPEQLGKLICDKIKAWGNQAGDITNLTHLLTLDYLNSADEWSDFESQKWYIAMEIEGAIFEEIRNETVSEVIDLFAVAR